MPQPFKLKTALVVAGLAGLASAMPLSASNADEPMQLDAAQLDAVSAGAFVGFSLLGGGDADGSLRSENSVIFNGTSTSSPAASTAVGTIISTSLAVGGDAPTATTNTTLGPPLAPSDPTDPDSPLVPIAPGPVGTPIVILPILIDQAGPGFAFSVNALAVAFVDTEIPVF